jgi:hypothetical protein
LSRFFAVAYLGFMRFFFLATTAVTEAARPQKRVRFADPEPVAEATASSVTTLRLLDALAEDPFASLETLVARTGLSREISVKVSGLALAYTGQPLWVHDLLTRVMRRGESVPNTEEIEALRKRGHSLYRFLTAHESIALAKLWTEYCVEPLTRIELGKSAPCTERGNEMVLNDARANTLLVAFAARQRVRRGLELLPHSLDRLLPTPSASPSLPLLAGSLEEMVLRELAMDVFVTDATIVARALSVGIGFTTTQVRPVRLGFLALTAKSIEDHNQLVRSGTTDDDWIEYCVRSVGESEQRPCGRRGFQVIMSEPTARAFFAGLWRARSSVPAPAREAADALLDLRNH